MELFTTVAVVLVLLTQSEADNSTECILTDISTRLDMASQILETTRQKLPSDLSELCKKNFKCPDCKNITQECKNITQECKNITQECKNIITYECKNITYENITQECKNITSVKPMDCSDLYQEGKRRDGLYDIWPQSRLHKRSFKVYCDMELNSGGWTVVQRRGEYNSPSDYFYKDWNSYKRGFGVKLKDFWIGNDNLFGLTNQRSYQLRVDLTDWEGKSAYAIYDEFWISDELQNYTLHVKGYSGTAGDALHRHDGCGFFTKDRDNKHKCAFDRKGAWWYSDCTDSNLNGLYQKGSVSKGMLVVFWETFRGPNYSLKETVMKIRPTDFDVKSPI